MWRPDFVAKMAIAIAACSCGRDVAWPDLEVLGMAVCSDESSPAESPVLDIGPSSTRAARAFVRNNTGERIRGTVFERMIGCDENRFSDERPAFLPVQSIDCSVSYASATSLVFQPSSVSEVPFELVSEEVASFVRELSARVRFELTYPVAVHLRVEGLAPDGRRVRSDDVGTFVELCDACRASSCL